MSTATVATALKVVQLSYCEWWLAPSIGTAIDAALKFHADSTGLDFDEIVTDAEEVRVLDALDMDEMEFEDDDGSRCTFTERFQSEVERDPLTIRFFAGGE